MQTDPIFEEEQHHLSETYAKLQSMERDLVAKMEKNSLDAAEDKIAMSEELSPNFASYADAMETYADFATVNRVIDAYNIGQRVDAERLSNIRLLYKQPYFAKLVLKLESDQKTRELYIGTAGISDESSRRMVVDWRSPVAEVYYNQENGPTSYQANGRTIEVDLKLRRQFDIKEDTLIAYFDTSVAIQDSLLLSSLSKHRSAHMQAITATIQKEQNLVIRHEDVPTLLVNGIAGSGKTSVLMQRIAYLFYQQRESLDPREVFLLTPNPVFRSYVDKVLPDLGESNPVCITWEEFMRGLIPSGMSVKTTTATPGLFERIDEVCQNIVFEESDFKDIRSGDERLLSAGQIRQVAVKFKKIPVGPHLITLMREELMKRLEARFAQMASSDKVLDALTMLSPDEQVELFHETFDALDEDETRALARQYVNTLHGGAFEAIRNDEWIRFDRIGRRYLDKDNLSSLEWLYLKMTLTGLGNPKAKYTMIDEVQDYTADQLKVLLRYFQRAHFLLLGDENQAIREGTASFAEIRSLFQHVRGPLQEYRLMTSYRSTSEITHLFADLLEHDERLQISSIQRSDTKPVIKAYQDEQEYDLELRRAIKDARSYAGLTAVVLPHKYQVKQLEKKLGNDAPPHIDDSTTLPETGVILVPLKLAKGLEFDHVIVADASERVFPGDELSRRRLYTTISRATRGIIILSKGTLTPLLSKENN